MIVCSGGQPLDVVGLVEQMGEALADGGDLFGEELRDLPRRSADVSAGVEDFVESGVGEQLILAEEIEEVVSACSLADLGSDRSAVVLDALMSGLTIAAGGDDGHQDVLGGHERQDFHDIAGDDGREHLQAVGDVQGQPEHAVGRQEGLRQGEPAVDAVVQGPLQPLRRRRLGGVARQADQEARQAAHPLAAHGVAFVGHRRGADLARSDGLIDLLAVGEQAQIGAVLVGRLPQAGQHIEDLAIDLARVGLAGDGEDPVEAHFACYQVIELAHAVVVASKQFEEAGLGAGGSLDASEAEGIQAVVDLVEVEHEVLAPQTGPFADGGQLGRLEVGKAHRGQVAPGEGEPGQGVDDAHHPIANPREPLAHEQKIGVVGDVATGGAEVDDPARLGSGFAVGVDVGHHVVAQLALVALGGGEIDVVDVVAHLEEHGRGDSRGDAVIAEQAHLGLRLGQGDPQFPPGGKFAARAPQFGHLRAGVAGYERVVPDIERIHDPLPRTMSGVSAHPRIPLGFPRSAQADASSGFSMVWKPSRRRTTREEVIEFF